MQNPDPEAGDPGPLHEAFPGTFPEARRGPRAAPAYRIVGASADPAPEAA